MTETTFDGKNRPLTIIEAAQALGFSRATINRRIADGTISTVDVGPTKRIPRSEIERLQGAPRTSAPADVERLIREGYLVPMPTRWLVHERKKHGGQAHGFIALVPLNLDGRKAMPGDLIAHGEIDGALEAMIARHQIAELPLEHGVLALLRSHMDRVAQLEKALAQARSEN